MSFLLMNQKSPGVYVNEVASGSAPIVGVGTGTAAVLLAFADAILVVADDPQGSGNPAKVTLGADSRVAVDVPQLVTNLSEFRDWAGNAPQSWLIAMAGFFANGGTRCHVVAYANLDTALEALQTRDDVDIVAAPGLDDAVLRRKIAEHCELRGDRMAILDGADKDPGLTSRYAAYYYPRVLVTDPADPNRAITVGPAAHIAGAWARVDATRGVHKAPANVELFGLRGVAEVVTRSDQDGLNYQGINVLRELQGGVRIHGARTLGGDANGEVKFINVQRTLIYIARSLDRGLQWVVFEPNTPALWGKVARNINAFLHETWATGALFGTTPEQAWYVRCDEAFDPVDERAQGKLTVEVGVALTRPAEFVVVNLTQWSGPGK